MKRLMHLNEDEKNLLNVMRTLANRLTAGYSYRGDWDAPTSSGEMYRDREYKRLVQDEKFKELFDNINLCNCDIDLLESIGFLKLDDESTAKGMRLYPLWYFEAMHRGLTKENKIDTDIRYGCVFNLVKVKDVDEDDARTSN